MVARGADGLLLIGHQRDPSLYGFLEKQGVPVLVAWVHDPDIDRISVGFDNHAAMVDMTRRVIAQGHRRLAMISAETEHNERARERVRGARDVLIEAGLDGRDLPVIETGNRIDGGGAAFEKLMQADPSPTAVMCGNDVLAIGALAKAREMGLSVPGDVSITGFDDLEIAKFTSPPLTTVRAPHQEMGREAAKMLVRMVAGETLNRRPPLETSIIQRGTLAPPKA